jgi:hypothetical protein
MNEFTDILRDATAAIAELYMQLPVEGGEARFRERVYCYELYHQLRCRWPEHGLYALNGEVDKRGHPFAALAGSQAIPDLLVHTPGNMAGNHVIIEVKPANAQVAGIREDFRKLKLFRGQDIHYERAIYLFYGPLNINRVTRVADEDEFASLPAVELWLHSASGVSAEHVITFER